MKHILKKLIYLIPLLFVAGMVGAYSDPSAGAPNSNTAGPITISAIDQIKPGPLTVGTFQARGNGWLQQSSFASGLVRGGLPADVNSTLVFGDDTIDIGGNSVPHNTNLDFSKNVSVAGTIQSDSLRGNGESRVCADVNGKFYRCNDQSGTSRIHLSLTYNHDDSRRDAACAYVRVKNLSTNQEYLVDAMQDQGGGGSSCSPVSTLGYVDAPSGSYTVTSVDIRPSLGATNCSVTYESGAPFTVGTNFQLTSSNLYLTGSCS